MKKTGIVFVFVLAALLPSAVFAREILPGAVDKMLVVTGKKTPEGIISASRGKTCVAVVRQRIQVPASVFQFNGTVSGNVRAVNVSIVALRQGKRVFGKSSWLDAGKMIRSEDGKKHFGGTLDCTGMTGDEIYFYFEGFTNAVTPVRIEKLSLQIRED